ncbi:RNA 3'-terminal phosphate cyclase [Candidatus Woesearchaeota archaeon]|nr:RNA 3'-terminal phosphate cyclase [Candidatus Woesearchaeota archaeon]
MDMIQIDGSYLEGGGQIVRTALALSVLTGKPFEVEGIRKGRKNSGLKNQHLYCIRSLQKLSRSEAEGAELGSERLRFSPGKFRASNIDIDIETAGSITLLLQSLLIPCMLGDKPIKLTIQGGTDTKWSMPADYFREILIPQLRRYADIKFSIKRRGYYPKGGGIVDIRISPRFSFSQLKDAPRIELTEQGNLMQIKGVSHCSMSLENARVADRQAESAKSALKDFECPVDIRNEYSESLSDGSGIVLWAIFSEHDDDIDDKNPIRIGSDSLGERGKRAEIVGKEAAERLKKQMSSNVPVDEYLADNLIPLLGLFGGSIRVAKISKHTLTNIYVVEKFLDVKFDVDEEKKLISVDNK